ANLFGIQSRGTLAAPTASLNEDIILKISGIGYDANNALGGGGGQESVSIAFAAKTPGGGPPVVGFVAGQFTVQTTDMSGAKATRIEIHDTGDMDLGGSLG